MEGWLIVALVMVILLAGLKAAVPSRWQRQLSKTRMGARQAGFELSWMFVRDVDAERDVEIDKKKQELVAPEKQKNCVVYQLAYYSPLKSDMAWQLIRSQKSMKPFAGWMLNDQFASELVPSETKFWLDLRLIVENLPPECSALQVDRIGVSWIGKESKELVESQIFLDSLSTSMQEIQQLCVDYIKRESAN